MFKSVRTSTENGSLDLHSAAEVEHRLSCLAASAAGEARLELLEVCSAISRVREVEGPRRLGVQNQLIAGD
jgi:hypothetical protein